MRSIMYSDEHRRHLIALAIVLVGIFMISSYVAISGHMILVSEVEEVDETESITLEENNTTEPEPEPEEEIPLPPSAMDKVIAYLEEHPQDDFKNQADRIDDVDLRGGTAYIEFVKGKTDGDYESWYLCGVLFLVFEDYDKVDATAYTVDDKLIDGSHKFPTREKYTFYYKHFPDVIPEEKKPECSSNLDCNDSDDCTRDGCYDGKCSNVFTFKYGCIR